MPMISSWMTKNVVIADQDTLAYDACVLMQKKQIGSLVVVDGRNQPLGIFTEHDALAKIVVKSINPKETKIKDLMTKNVKTVNPNEDYRRVYSLMSAYNINHLPVIDDEKNIIGIISLRDLMRSNMRIMENTIFELKKEKEFLQDLFGKNADKRTRQLYIENKKLQQLILLDSLTGLFNHRYFKNIIKKEVWKAKRYGHPLTLLFIDIDHFKHYNDTNGHELGNKVLMQIAELLKTTSRKINISYNTEYMDVLARYGGEEFVILMPETNYTQGFSRAERLINDIRNFNFVNKEFQPTGKLTISIGIAELPKHASSADELIKAADKALYKAKDNGRDQIY